MMIFQLCFPLVVVFGTVGIKCQNAGKARLLQRLKSRQGVLSYGTVVLMRSKASHVLLHTPACETS